MEPLPVISESPDPLPSARFSERDIELAHQMRALGLEWQPATGVFVYDDLERFPGKSPLQEHVFFILDLDLFVRIAGGYDRLKAEWTWLPTWEDGCQWLRQHGKNEAEILDRVRETCVDDGISAREALYGLMISILHAEKARGLDTG